MKSPKMQLKKFTYSVVISQRSGIAFYVIFMTLNAHLRNVKLADAIVESHIVMTTMMMML